MTSFSSMMNAALAGQPHVAQAGAQPLDPQLCQQWPGVQPTGAPLPPAAAAGAWQQGLAGHQAALHASRAAPVPQTGGPMTSTPTAGVHQADGDLKGSRKRGSSAAAFEEKPAARSSSEGYRERWLAKKPRPNPNSWLSSVCSACEQPGTEAGEATFTPRFSIAELSPFPLPRC